MQKLNLTERAMLEGARAEPDEPIYPWGTGRLSEVWKGSIADLIARGLAEDREIPDRLSSYRTEDGRHYAVFATETGLAADIDDRQQGETLDEAG